MGEFRDTLVVVQINKRNLSLAHARSQGTTSNSAHMSLSRAFAVRMTPQRISMPRPKPKFNLPTAALPYKKRHAPVVSPKEPLKSRYLSNKEWRASMARQPDEVSVCNWFYSVRFFSAGKESPRLFVQAFVCAIGTGERQSFCASLFSGESVVRNATNRPRMHSQAHFV